MAAKILMEGEIALIIYAATFIFSKGVSILRTLSPSTLPKDVAAKKSVYFTAAASVIMLSSGSSKPHS